eukprot:CAMPEP_0170120972 /NCGR_PEP_ID=MMETSP0020_2-20130122/15525_1 /TAXON_ID=98059 /ORGANISM="Dinobryon sp., Strain UTEXLB2267" /LENGTH=252 /DNA_ID=CAMNT_0010351067 /DNA_START=379 /DNA_END=1133 /DNA_ORIENTATION=+
MNNTATSRLRKLEAKLSSIASKTNNGGKTSKMFPISRVSDECTGLLVFAKSSEVRNEVKRAWGSFGKTYLCICEGLVSPANGCIRTLLNVSSEVVTVVRHPNSSSPEAVSNYRTLQTARVQGRLLSLLEVTLDTDLRDQVRAQLSSLGHPILGDLKYPCLSSNPLRRLALHCCELRLLPPRGPWLTLRAPAPPDFTQLLLRGEADHEDSPWDRDGDEDGDSDESREGDGARRVAVLAVGAFLKMGKPPRPRP